MPCMDRLRKLCLYLVFCFIPAIPLSAFALTSEAITAPPQIPTTVDVGFKLINLANVDSKNGNFTIKYFIHYGWTDGRLQAKDVGYYMQNKVADILPTIWQPDIIFENEVAKPSVQYQDLTIGQNGKVDVHAVGVVTLNAPFDLKDYPFDVQELPIILQSSLHDSNTVVLKTTDSEIAMNENMQFNAWSFRDFSYQMGQAKTFFRDMVQSQIKVLLTVKRGMVYYVTKLYVPLLSFVLVTCAIFCYTDGEFRFKIPVVLTCLVLMALFSLRAFAEIPHINYFTRLDKIIALSRLWLIAAFALNIYFYFSRKSKQIVYTPEVIRKEVAIRLILPVSYLLLWLYAIIVGFNL